MKRAATGLATAALVAALAVPCAAHAAFDLEALMALLRSHPPGRVHFDETRTVSILDRPLDSSGELIFTPPDQLEKRVTSPGRERLVADSKQIVIEGGGHRDVIALAEHPEVAVLVESMRATLAGDRAALERSYTAALQGDAAAWRLVLRPRDAGQLRLVSRVEIEGNQASVRRVLIEQADGDRSLMQLSPASP